MRNAKDRKNIKDYGKSGMILVLKIMNIKNILRRLKKIQLIFTPNLSRAVPPRHIILTTSLLKIL